MLRVAQVRHKPGRRCLLRYELRVGSGPTRHREHVYGKTFASERGSRVFQTLRTIAGVRPWGPSVAVGEPIAYLPSLRLLLQHEVEGVPSRPALLAGDEQLAAQIAEALHTLHDSAVCLERNHGLEDELATLANRVASSRAGRPAHRCLAVVENAFERPFGWRLRPIHRDFYHEQVLVSSSGLALIDFDDAAMSEPAVDVANFLAHLRLLALEEPSKATAIAAASAAFAARYGDLDAQLDPLLVRVLESATLLRLACIHEPFAEQLINESLARVA